MKLPKYRLQIVLDRRQKAKEDAEKALSEAQKALENERKKEQECVQAVEAAKQKKEDYKVEMNRKIMEENLEVEKIKMLKNYLKTLDFEIKKAEERLEEQKHEVQKAEQDVEQKRKILVEATTEHQAMEKHKEKWMETVKKEIEEAEAKEQEEVGNVLYLQRKTKE